MREIHGSVGDLNQFLGRGAVVGEGGDAQAGGDVFRAQEGIAKDAGAQFFGELAAVIHVAFRHENDKLVAAVAGDHVGGAAVLLEDAADALEDQIAFEMSEEIVDELEAIEIGEQQAEGAAARVERFHSAERASRR